MSFTSQKNTEGNYEVFQDGNRVATGTQAILANYGLPLPSGASSAATSTPTKIAQIQPPPPYVSSTDVAGQFANDKAFIDTRMQPNATDANGNRVFIGNPDLNPGYTYDAKPSDTKQTIDTKPKTQSQEQSGNLATYADRLAAGQQTFDAKLASDTADANARLQTTLSTLGTQFDGTKASITSQYADLIKKTERLKALDVGRRNAYGLGSAVYDPIGHTDSVTQATDEWNAEIAKYNTERDAAIQQAQIAFEQGKAGALAASRKEVTDIEDRIRQSTQDFQAKLADKLKTANESISLKYQEFDERGKLAAQKALIQFAAYKDAKTPEERDKLIADAIYSVGGDPNNAAEYAAVKDALDGKITSDARTAFETQKNALDLKNTQSQIDDRTFQHSLDLAKLHLDQQKANNEGAAGMDPSQLVAYAQQYASTGAIPTGLPKGTFGVVAQFAKEAPKPEGTLVDRNTGIKPSALSSVQEDGIVATRDLVNKLDDLKDYYNSTYTGILPGLKNAVAPSKTNQQFNDLRGEIVDLLARSRTGAVIGKEEERTYSGKLPGNFSKPLFFGKDGGQSIDDLKKSLQGKLDTALTTHGVSIYGYSTVKLGGQEYKVGDTIEVNGKKGRVLPDGTIAELPNN